MPQEDQQDFYARRERECRVAAELATDPSVRLAHLIFAQSYAAEVDQFYLGDTF